MARPGIRFSPDPDDDFDIRCVLGLSVEGASDIGEVLAAVAGVRKGDHESWFRAWHDLGARTLQTADAAASGAHPVSAAEAYLRASTYFATAVNAVAALPDDDQLLPTFRLQQKAWDAFVDRAPVPVERVSIAYGDGALPGYLFHPAHRDATIGTLVAVNGSDGSLAALWGSCVAAGLRRGYRVLVFDGPGQQSELFEHDVPFRPDWENVLTPVYEYLAAREDVDAARIAVYGISQAGYWVPRALAFEHRFAAAIADPGVVDVSTSWTGHLPKSMLGLLERGETEKFDREMALAMKLSPTLARTWRFRARPYRTDGYAETIAAVRQYDVAGVAAQITTPLLITSPENEQFWPGQAERLAELTASVSTLVRFTAAEGADEHCQPLARSLTAQRMFDWLDERVA
jgi:hypothetical protein